MRFLAFLFTALVSLNVAAGYVSVPSPHTADTLVQRLEHISQAQGFKWVRKVPLEDELGPGAPRGWAVYFCDVQYIGRLKADNPLAGATGPCRSVVLGKDTGSELLMALPTAKRAVLGDPSLAMLALEAKMLMVAALAAEEEARVQGHAPIARQVQVHAYGMPYPETMNSLQDVVTRNGFDIVRVQHMDKGLQSGGYASGPYKILYIRPTTLPARFSPAVLMSLPAAVLVAESPEGEGLVATLGIAAPASEAIDQETQLWLWGQDAKLSKLLKEL